MSKSNYTGGQSKSSPKLKLAHFRKPPPRLRLGGMEPSEDMPAGEHKVACEGASKKPSAEGWRIELKYRVIDGPHAGTALRQWMPTDASGVVHRGAVTRNNAWWRWADRLMSTTT